MMALILDSIAETSRSRGWTLHAAAAVSSHVHAIVGAPVMGLIVVQAIREDSARLLSTRGLHDESVRLWSKGGYFTMIHTSSQLERVVEYVNRHRGPDGRGPSGETGD